jgi:hypothetical protein
VVDVSKVVFDKQEQVDQIVGWLVPGEKLLAVFDCKGTGTGFIAITNKRLMYHDKKFLAKRKALTSVPLRKIAEVASIDEGRGVFGAGSSNEIVVKTADGEHVSFEFRGTNRAHRAYMFIMREVLKADVPARDARAPQVRPKAPAARRPGSRRLIV